jgi:hypothetical protein
VKFEAGQLVVCYPSGEPFQPAQPIAPGKAVANNKMVIYELPTSWTRINIQEDPEIGVGTFQMSWP